MVADEITRIKEAESEAMALVANARSRADDLLRGARSEREAILGRWETEARRERERIIEAARTAARDEAARILHDETERAEALRREAEVRMAAAAEYILSRVAGEGDARSR